MRKVKIWYIYFFLGLVLLTGLSIVLERNPDDGESAIQHQEELILWYTDPGLTDFLISSAEAYHTETGIRVVPVFHEGIEYLEAIFDASTGEHVKDMPDLYIADSSDLGRAYDYGIAVAMGSGNEEAPGHFPKTAVNAVTYKGLRVGSPLYYDTAALLYNYNYMELAAVSAAERADAETVGEVTEVEDGMEDITVDPLTVEDAIAMGFTADSVMPGTIEDILEFANTYDAPQEVESLLDWDVSDLLYNYFFVGNYVDIGGEQGDDPTVSFVDNEYSRQCMETYGSLSQFFSIDCDAVKYQDVIRDFIAGKTVMTIVSTDAAKIMAEEKAAGRIPFEYRFRELPDISGNLQSRGLSITKAVAVNEHSHHIIRAIEFAEYLSTKRGDELYKLTGHLPADKSKLPEVPGAEEFQREYEKSTSLPKLEKSTEFWINLEALFSRVWNGEDAAELLAVLQERMK